MTKVDESSNLYSFIYDAKRFALYSRSMIEYTPLQINYSALIFAFKKSTIWKQFKKNIAHWIHKMSKEQKNWGEAQQTLEGRSGSIWSLTFSSNSKLVTFGSHDRTVRLWDVATSVAQGTLDVDTEIQNLSFSFSGRYLETDREVINISSSVTSTTSYSSNCLRNVFVLNRWIIEEEKIL